MYQVLDNGKPADCNHHHVHHSWGNSTFDTYEDALDYAQKWLGGWGGNDIPVNTEVDYSGYGDIIEIRKIENRATKSNVKTAGS